MVERQSVRSHESSAPAPFRTNIERLFFSSAESAQDGARARAFLDASPMVPLPEDCADRAGLRPLVPAASAAGDLDETFVHVQEDVPLLTTRLPTSFASHSLNTGRADEDEDPSAPAIASTDFDDAKRRTLATALVHHAASGESRGDSVREGGQREYVQQDHVQLTLRQERDDLLDLVLKCFHAQMFSKTGNCLMHLAAFAWVRARVRVGASAHDEFISVVYVQCCMCLAV